MKRGGAGAELSGLAAVLRLPPESDALVILVRLLDLLPVGFCVSECADDFALIHYSRTWERLVQAQRPPVTGKSLGGLFDAASALRVVQGMRDACATAEPAHLKQLPGLRPRERARGTARRWDLDLYPLLDAAGRATYLLSVVIEGRRRRSPSGLPGPAPRDPATARGSFGGAADLRGPARPAPASVKELSAREHQVADLVARGMTNAAIAARLRVTTPTVSSHVAHILEKLGFGSRTQLAVWVVEHRLRAGGPPGPPSATEGDDPR